MAYVKKKNLPGGDKRVTNDPMEATYIGIHIWAHAAEQAGSTDVDAVRQAIGYQKFKAPSGFEIRWTLRTTTCTSRSSSARSRRTASSRSCGRPRADPRAGLEPLHPREREEGRRLDVPLGLRQLHRTEVCFGNQGPRESPLIRGE